MSNEIMDPYVRRAREAREGSSAVQKAKLATLRGRYPDLLIFAFEGLDDKIVYYHWMKRLIPEVPYESMICNGKRQILQLFDALERDQTGLKKKVYFFLDRDFDGLQGRQDDGTAFVTAAYSIENYLVNEEVLIDLLKVEMHCHLQPELRELVVKIFRRVYDSFLRETRDLNLRIFVARRRKIAQIEDLPSKVNQIATVFLDTVVRTAQLPETLVLLEREPMPSEVVEEEAEFDRLNPALDYRGKFAMLFFKRWLELLANERNSKSSELFREARVEDFVARQSFTLDQLAAKARVPDCLTRFIQTTVAS